MSRLRDEAIKAAEDKKEEEKKREEEEREKKPGKDGIRVRLKIFTIFLYSFLNCCRFKIRLQFNSRWRQSESKPTEKGTEAKEKENDR